jgi:hypothetical protein
MLGGAPLTAHDARQSADRPCVALIYCRIIVLTNNQREALKLLADAADSYTVPFMLNNGCSVAALRHLARYRLVVTDGVREPGRRRLTIARLRISDTGRKALAR